MIEHAEGDGLLSGLVRLGAYALLVAIGAGCLLATVLTLAAAVRGESPPPNIRAYYAMGAHSDKCGHVLWEPLSRTPIKTAEGDRWRFVWVREYTVMYWVQRHDPCDVEEAP